MSTFIANLTWQLAILLIIMERRLSQISSDCHLDFNPCNLRNLRIEFELSALSFEL
jgi:hypothetical protein